MVKDTLRNYYRLAKPGIVYGNVFTTIAAFLFAWRWHFDSLDTLWLFLATVIGISLVIASACVFNNYLDRDIDRKMKRTQNRPLVTGVISVRSALIYGSIMGLIGLALLYRYVNSLTGDIALFGFLSYVIVYGFAKRTSSWGAVVGSIPGAVPIVVGYTAVVGQIDLAAVILFVILVAWQMPHFYGIAMYRLDDYAEAGIPTLPIQKGMRTTKLHIVWYIVAYLLATVALTVFGYAGIVYLVSVVVFGIWWLRMALLGFKTRDDAKWARKVFLFSLIVLVSFCVTLALSPLLP